MTSDQQQPALIQQKVLEIGTRLKTAPSDRMISSVFGVELSHQTHLFEAMGLADIAHTLIAIELKTIPKTDGYQLLTQLLELQNKPASFVLSPSRGDIYTNREAWLAERTDAVGWLGAGRARREATTTAFVLVMRQLFVEFIETLMILATAMVQKAEQHALSLMPGLHLSAGGATDHLRTLFVGLHLSVTSRPGAPGVVYESAQPQSYGLRQHQWLTITARAAKTGRTIGI